MKVCYSKAALISTSVLRNLVYLFSFCYILTELVYFDLNNNCSDMAVCKCILYKSVEQASSQMASTSCLLSKSLSFLPIFFKFDDNVYGYNTSSRLDKQSNLFRTLEWWPMNHKNLGEISLVSTFSQNVFFLIFTKLTDYVCNLSQSDIQSILSRHSRIMAYELSKIGQINLVHSLKFHLKFIKLD